MHSRANPSGVRFTGPLAPFAVGLGQEVAALGYLETSATILLQFAAHLSRWLAVAGLGPSDLSEEVIDRFLLDRRRSYSNHYSHSALSPILGYLRRVGAAPEALVVPATAAPEKLLERFSRHLTAERALTLPVVRAYCHWVGPFVETVCCAGGAAVREDLTSGDVTRFLVDRMPGMSKKSAQMTASSLRSFLRFLHSEGITRSCLADAVLHAAYWRLSGLARPLDDAQLGALRDACDPSEPVGRRDLAVIVVLSRLGLRCAEAAALQLEDVDWPDGTITVHGKGNRTDRLPLPVDVGEAVVDYLRHGRPDTVARAVFVRVYAPHTALAPSSVSCIVARAARRAGLGTVHGHRLRHTAASKTLNTGASLEEVALLMRHAGPATTFGYAKTDLDRLARLARRWPAVGDPR